VPTLLETAHGIYGAWRLAWLDRNAMALFDQSVDGFWKSFFAAVIVAPGQLYIVLGHLRDSQTESSALSITLIESLGYALGWLAFPVAMLPLVQLMQREQHYIGFIVAGNWATVLQIGVVLPVLVLGHAGAIPAALLDELTLVTLVLVLAYKWFIARFALSITGLPAAGIVLLDVVIAMLIAVVTDSMLGIRPA
jgi:hypothetical protein